MKEKGADGNYPVQETQRFIQFITPGFKNKLSEELTSKCFLKLATHTRKFIYEHNTEIIEALVPNTVKDWHKDDGACNIIEGLVLLICEEPNYTKCQ